MKTAKLSAETYAKVLDDLHKLEEEFRAALEKCAARDPGESDEDGAIYDQILKLGSRIAAQGLRAEKASPRFGRNGNC